MLQDKNLCRGFPGSLHVSEGQRIGKVANACQVSSLPFEIDGHAFDICKILLAQSEPQSYLPRPHEHNRQALCKQLLALVKARTSGAKATTKSPPLQLHSNTDPDQSFRMWTENVLLTKNFGHAEYAIKVKLVWMALLDTTSTEAIEAMRCSPLVNELTKSKVLFDLEGVEKMLRLDLEALAHLSEPIDLTDAEASLNHYKEQEGEQLDDFGEYATIINRARKRAARSVQSLHLKPELGVSMNTKGIIENSEETFKTIVEFDTWLNEKVDYIWGLSTKAETDGDSAPAEHQNFLITELGRAATCFAHNIANCELENVYSLVDEKLVSFRNAEGLIEYIDTSEELRRARIDPAYWKTRLDVAKAFWNYYNAPKRGDPCVNGGSKWPSRTGAVLARRIISILLDRMKAGT